MVSQKGLILPCSFPIIFFLNREKRQGRGGEQSTGTEIPVRINRSAGIIAQHCFCFSFTTGEPASGIGIRHAIVCFFKIGGILLAFSIFKQSQK